MSQSPPKDAQTVRGYVRIADLFKQNTAPEHWATPGLARDADSETHLASEANKDSSGRPLLSKIAPGTRSWFAEKVLSPMLRFVPDGVN